MYSLTLQIWLFQGSCRSGNQTVCVCSPCISECIFKANNVCPTHRLYLFFPLVLYSRFSLVICFIHCSIYMSIPISQFLPPPPLPAWRLYICSLCHLCRVDWRVEYIYVYIAYGLLGGSDSKESACYARDLGSIPGPGRLPGERPANPLQYSCLENFMDRGARRAIVHGVAKSLTQRATNTFTPLSFIAHTGGAKPIYKSLGPL